jgi:hypothetical protein
LWLPVEHLVEYSLAHMPMDGDADQQLGVGVDVGVGDFVPLSRHTLTRRMVQSYESAWNPISRKFPVRLAWSGDFVRFSRALSVLEVRVWVWLV